MEEPKLSGKGSSAWQQTTMPSATRNVRTFSKVTCHFHIVLTFVLCTWYWVDLVFGGLVHLVFGGLVHFVMGGLVHLVLGGLGIGWTCALGIGWTWYWVDLVLGGLGIGWTCALCKWMDLVLGGLVHFVIGWTWYCVDLCTWHWQQEQSSTNWILTSLEATPCA